jgi:hypothetical protein
MMRYVSRGAKAKVRITQALDLRAEVFEEETARERGAIKNRDNYPIFDLVTLKGTLLLINRKAEKVTVRIQKPFTGEHISSTGSPVVTTTNRGLRDTNAGGRLVWEKDVEPGKELKLEYNYKVYVRSQ